MSDLRSDGPVVVFTINCESFLQDLKVLASERVQDSPPVSITEKIFPVNSTKLSTKCGIQVLTNGLMFFLIKDFFEFDDS